MLKYFDILEKINFWKNNSEDLGIYRYDYAEQILSQTDSNLISAVIGVRRSGKSTILKQVLLKLINKNVNPLSTLYINFEDPRLVDLSKVDEIFELLEDFGKLYRSKKKYIVFDEVQNLESWEKVVRTIQDSYPNYKIFISGSSAKMLAREFASSLSGRYIQTEVFPLNYALAKKNGHKNH